jgi:hypothetical protein
MIFPSGEIFSGYDGIFAFTRRPGAVSPIAAAGRWLVRFIATTVVSFHGVVKCCGVPAFTG